MMRSVEVSCLWVEMGNRMGKKASWLLVLVAFLGAGCTEQGNANTSEGLESCYAKAEGEAELLEKATAPLLTPEMQTTLQTYNDCDSDVEGGVWITYDADTGKTSAELLRKFYSAGWVNVSLPIEPCGDRCVAGVTKIVQGRRILVTVENFPADRDLVVVFDD
ncbi:hypothetical protein [Nonomuraea sp. B1E8]|uniref:hypothetical protein n=1 Tax=unclassified Nonomuraea TaxID=2593643 RepID=UPI00325DFAD5